VKRAYTVFYFITMLLLSIPALKLGMARVGQLFLLLLFLFMIIDEINKKKIDFFILSYFFIGSLVLVLISLNSTYEKIGESKFFIKYLFIFPAAFYIGAKAIQKLGKKEFITILEVLISIYIFIAFLIYFDLFPFRELITYRVGFGGQKYIEFQGTFAEAGIMAEIVYMSALIALLMRYEFDIWQQNKIYNLLFYIVVFISLVMTKNKTIWVSLVAISFILVFLKSIFLLLYSNSYQPYYKRVENQTLKILEKIDSIKLLLFSLFVLGVLYFINSIMDDPIVTMKMIEVKLHQERGKAFLYAMDLLKDSSWMGCYGFGFVEYYFSHLPVTIIGLGEKVGMLFHT